MKVISNKSLILLAGTKVYGKKIELWLNCDLYYRPANLRNLKIGTHVTQSPNY